MAMSPAAKGYLRDGIYFVLGLGVGIMGTKLILEKKYEALATEQIEEVKTRYHAKEAYRVKKAQEMAQEQVDEVIEATEEYVEGQDREILFTQNKPDLATYVNETLINKHNYATPVVKLDSEELDRKIEESAEEAVPELISLDQFTDECQYHEKATITFYAEDQTFVDEYEELVPDPNLLLGDLDEENWTVYDDDPDVMYIRNVSTSTDYEVIRVYKSSGL